MKFAEFRKKLIPKVKSVLKKRFYFIFDYKLKLEVKKIRDNQENILKEIRKKEVINVIFLAIHDSVWKYEEVYRLLNEDSKFNVKVVVIPLVREGKGDMNTYYQTLKYFNNNEYNTIGSYDEKDNSWLDIKSITNPDITFFTNPHKLTFEKYYIDNFTDTLTCYVPYSFQVSNLYKAQFNQPFHNKIWTQFYETKLHEKIGQKYSDIKGANIEVSGYPGIDKFINKELNTIESDPWIFKKNKSIKRIIWAPHHTIKGQGAGLDYSSFLDIAEFIIDLSKKYSNEIQVAFKPHPLLKQKLYENSNWGLKRTNEYYSLWEQMPNTLIHDKNYDSLFINSDGMIHDSGSFTAEYLLLNKPVMFTASNSEVLGNFNDFGKKCLKNHYLASTTRDIEDFIINVILNSEDYLKEKRNVFILNNCFPPNNKTASENIIKYIKLKVN